MQKYLQEDVLARTVSSTSTLGEHVAETQTVFE